MEMEFVKAQRYVIADPLQSAKTLVAIPQPVSSKQELSAAQETAASHASSNLMAPHAGMLLTSATYWSTALDLLLSVQQMCTSRMASPVPMDRGIATLGHAQHWTTSASISTVKVLAKVQTHVMITTNGGIISAIADLLQWDTSHAIQVTSTVAHCSAMQVAIMRPKLDPAMSAFRSHGVTPPLAYHSL